MNHFRQYLPGFIDPFEVDRQEFDFQTEEELLQSELLAEYSSRRNFSRFSLSGDALLAEFGPEVWLVLGFIQKPAELSLPQWRAPQRNLHSRKDSACIPANKVLCLHL